jgi:predicted nucleotidyltransferase
LEVKQLTKQGIINVINDQKDLLDKYGVKSISLFGSYVRNEQREDSGIDFLVEFERDTYHNFINLICDLESVFKKDVRVVTKSDLSKYIRPFILEEAEKIER